jgi:hypothetical protein
MKTTPVVTKAGNVASLSMAQISESELKQAMASL